MTGVKTNERPGTKCQVRYVRMSASKVRVVLDLIRGKHVGEAAQILAFSDRLAAKVIDKALRSAVANAGHNDEVPAEELYVSACFADEGASLKRFRPRARGRAGRIRKQTCHITIVVSRYTDEQLDAMRARAEARGATRGSRPGGAPDARADRRRRVAGSRAATGSEAAAPVDEAVSKDQADTPEDTVVEDTVVEEAVVEEAVVETDTVEETELTPPTPSDEVVADAEADSVDDSTPTDETASESDDAEETN